MAQLQSLSTKLSLWIYIGWQLTTLLVYCHGAMRKEKVSLIALMLCITCLGVELAYLQPSTVPDALDFGQLYRSIERAYQGQTLYSLAPALVESNSLISELRGDLPFPGPPWYTALFLPLGLLSSAQAALAWALINIGLVCSTVALVSRPLAPVSLGLVSLMALVSAPVQGHLVVGQFTVIIGFGFALTTWASRLGKPMFTSLGLILTTFKPHLGAPFMLVALATTGKSSLRQLISVVSWSILLFVLLALLALLIDPISLTSYLPYLQKLNSLPVNKVCDTCSSLPIVALRPWQDQLEQLWTARFILTGLCWLALTTPLLIGKTSTAVVLSGAMYIALLAAPYARNYDYVLLVAPILLSWREASHQLTGRELHIVRGLLVASATLAGIVPYLTERSLHSSYLWLAPVIGYISTTIIARGSRTGRSSPHATST